MSAFFFFLCLSVEMCFCTASEGCCIHHPTWTKDTNAFLATTGFAFTQRHPKGTLFLQQIPLYHDGGNSVFSKRTDARLSESPQKRRWQGRTTVHQCSAPGLPTPTRSLGEGKVESRSWTGWPSSCRSLILSDKWVYSSRKNKSIQ